MTLILSIIPTTSAFAQENYSDVPNDSWAKESIYAAKDYNIMNGQSADNFGYGKTITKAEFATILCNMFKWTKVMPSKGSFQDVAEGSWYYTYVETALSNDAIIKDEAGTVFSPNAPITREEMAVMFVRALGLSDAAKLADSFSLPFTDVIKDKGYIAVAYDIGMINGMSSQVFAPENTAKREEAAAMLTRVYAKYYGDTEFLHGFYAISSYSQKELTADMDAVTLGWSTMTLDSKGAWLNTGSENNNQYKIPSSYENVTSYLDANKTKAHLGVYMDTSAGAKELLLSSEKRSQAVTSIIAELNKIYTEIGKNPYSGVTIDFEGLKGSDVKSGFNSFLTELSAQLKANGKTLYVAVQPALSDGIYFDGFDYKTIGNLADKVILMAHDYNPTSLEGYVGTEWYKNTAITPISKVYYSLKMATDSTTGVSDKSKLVLAISFATLAWQLDDNAKLLQAAPAYGSSDVVNSYLKSQGTVTGFSKIYRNPYMTYKTSEGKNMFLWYENEQSVSEKAALARLFGINGISLWRLGNIPTYSGYNVMDSIK